MIRSLPVVAAALLACGTASAQTITSLSETTLPRSGRLIIEGTGFGASPGVVLIDDIEAPVSFWSDTKVRAYVPEAATLGAVDVAVMTDEGTSDPLTLTVELRPPADGRIRWRFMMDDQSMPAQPAVAPDGTVYATGIFGHLYALTPDGGLKWVRTVNGGRPAAVGSDGTVYVGGDGGVVAFDPDGNLLWSTPLSGSLYMGPNVGPDGNIYGATDLVDGVNTGTGAFVMSPDGDLLWTFDDMSIRGIPLAWEVVFTDNRWYVTSGMGGPTNGLYGIFAFDLGGGAAWDAGGRGQAGTGAGLVGVNDPDGNSVVAFTEAGAEQWRRTLNELGGQPGPNTMGPDGATYVQIQLAKLYAIAADGNTRWLLDTAGGGPRPEYPQVRPDNGLVLVGGNPNGDYLIQGFDPQTGEPLFSQALDRINGVRIAQFWYPAFAPDGETAYIPTNGAVLGEDAWTYLYAFDTTLPDDAPAPDLNDDGSVNILDLLQLIGAWGDCAACPEDLTGDGTVDIGDLLLLLGAWG